MYIEIKLGCVPANELPMFFNCICKMNIIHNANIANEDGKGGYSIVIKSRQAEAKILKNLLHENINLLCNIKNGIEDLERITRLNNTLSDYGTDIEINGLTDNLKTTLENSEETCINTIGEIFSKLLGITYTHDLNKAWLQSNIYDYINILQDFVNMPVDNLTVE